MNKKPGYKDELIKISKKLPREQVKEVINFANYLSWQSMPKQIFSERIDNLWVKMRNAAEKKGYKLKDVAKLIKQSRSGK